MTNLARSMKPKKCRHCTEVFTPQRMGQIACGYQCALAITRIQQTRELKRKRLEQSRELRARKEAIKPRSKWLKEAQAAFNSYIRARDAGKPCISSGRLISNSGLLTGSRMDAGHYRSIGAASHLRFNTFNCHGQSVHDNRDKSGNAVEYRIRLIERIGLARVEQLECNNEPRSFDIEYLRRVKRIFTRRARHIAKIRGVA